MKDFKSVVAIDVSKKTLDTCFTNNVELVNHQCFKFENTEEGFETILDELNRTKSNKDEVLFIFEHTGVYAIKLAAFLQSKGLLYTMVSGLELSKSGGISRGKSDKVDAKRIAVYAFSNAHKLKATSLPNDEIQRIQLLLTERDKLVKAIKQFEMTSEAKACYPKKLFRDVDIVNQRTIKYLKKQLKHIEKRIDELVKENKEIKEQYDLATSVIGVGAQTALHIIVTTRCFSLFPNWRKMACFSGIAPMPYESGSTLRGRRRISHLADKKLKSLLSMAAMSAKRYDPEIKRYYERKKAEGKHHRLIMNAIRCKVLSRIFATVKRGTPYVNTSKFLAA